MNLKILHKWQKTIEVSWSNLLVYKLNFFLTVIGPMLVFFFVKINLWSSIFANSQTTILSGYSLRDMLSYHLWVMIASMITISSTSQHIAEDIRLGKITFYLIYPFSLWEFHAAKYLARQSVQLLIVFITVALSYLLFSSYLTTLSFYSLLFGILLALFAGLFWFSMSYLIGLLGFWMEETWTIMVLFQIITYFLSGAIIPLDLFPAWSQEILFWTPFPYISYIPAKTFMGEYPALPQLMGVMSCWILLLLLITRQVWRKGLNFYTAAGM
jgi:ABC-2 type transport system permease protein